MPKIYYRHQYQTYFNSTSSLVMDGCSRSSTIKTNKRPLISTVGLRRTKLRLEHKAKSNAKKYIIVISNRRYSIVRYLQLWRSVASRAVSKSINGHSFPLSVCDRRSSDSNIRPNSMPKNILSSSVVDVIQQDGISSYGGVQPVEQYQNQ